MRRTLPIAALAAAAALAHAVPRTAWASRADAAADPSEVRVAANQRARAHDLSQRHEQPSGLGGSHPANSRGQPHRR
jgi:hypothetical protein